MRVVLLLFGASICTSVGFIVGACWVALFRANPPRSIDSAWLEPVRAPKELVRARR
jgi:hypothetical protein